MILEAIILGVLIGIFRNGRFYNLIEVEFKGWYFVFLGAALQIIPIAFTKLTEEISFLSWAPFAGVCLIWLGVLMNHKLKGFKLLAFGAALNLLVMLLHGGKMPIHLGFAEHFGISAIVESVKSGTMANLMPFDQAHGIFKWLGKVIPIPRPYPLAKMISIGDFIISIAIVYFIQGEMVFYHFKSKSRMLKFSIKSKY